MKCFRLALGLLAVLTFFILAVINCGGGGGDTSNDITSETIETASFTLAAGETRLVNGDLTINASDTVTIAGSIVSSGLNSQSLTIRASGDVIISGAVSAGSGTLGEDGGDLVIESSNGNIVLTDTATISAGDAGDGQSELTVTNMVLTDTNGVVERKSIQVVTAGLGGWIRLKAPNGSVQLPRSAGAIHLGNGGNGADIEVYGNDMLYTDAKEKYDTDGGDAGYLEIIARSIVGPEFETSSFPEDLVNPINGKTSSLAGMTIYHVTIMDYFKGGKGGDGGSYYWGINENGETFPPNDDQLRASVYLMNATNEDDESVSRFGSNGGSGYDCGSAGNATAHGLRTPSKFPMNYGDPGQSAYAKGGNAGKCTDVFTAKKRKGGDAIALAGYGGKGPDPGGEGGAGGSAHATGGNSGIIYHADLDAYSFPGTGGSAYSKSGDGGDGGGDCPSLRVGRRGGTGGVSGKATAEAGYGPLSPMEDQIFDDSILKKATAKIGKSGDGGDGEISSGDPGQVVHEPSVSGRGGKEERENGLPGGLGQICPTFITPTPDPSPNPSPEPSPDETPEPSPSPDETPDQTTEPEPQPSGSCYCTNNNQVSKEGCSGPLDFDENACSYFSDIAGSGPYKEGTYTTGQGRLAGCIITFRCF